MNMLTYKDLNVTIANVVVGSFERGDDEFGEPLLVEEGTSARSVVESFSEGKDVGDNGGN